MLKRDSRELKKIHRRFMRKINKRDTSDQFNIYINIYPQQLIERDSMFHLTNKK